MRTRPPQLALKMAAGLSAHPEAASAGAQACEQAAAALDNGRADLVQVFFTPHHAEHIPAILAAARRTLNPACLVGVSAESVIGGTIELERAPGVAVLAARLPGVTLTPFTAERLQPAGETPEALARIAETIGVSADLRATFLFADPFSLPLVKLLPAMNRARGAGRNGAAGANGEGANGSAHASPGVLVGGLASGAKSAGGNSLILNDRVMHSGAVGVSLSGNIRVDAVVSQGCRPFGPTVVVTKAKGNVIFELAGKPTAETVQEAITDLGDRARKVLKDGLLIGRVVNEYKDRFGRADFLIRNVVGLDPQSGGIAVADIVKVGQTIRFHVRDKATAAEDLALLMDGEKLHDRPAGCLLISCNSRGARLFGRPHNDASTVARAFAPPQGGEELSKGGTAIEPGSTPASIPIAGFFAQGEIGPVGEESYLHSHTACVVLFREAAGIIHP